MRVPIVTINLAEALPVAIVVSVQPIHYKGVCSYPAHLFKDVLAKVGNVKNATSIVQAWYIKSSLRHSSRDSAICLRLMSMTVAIVGLCLSYVPS
jgi:hypothetical protein